MQFLLKPNDMSNIIYFSSKCRALEIIQSKQLFSKDPLPLSKMIVIVKPLFKINLSANPCKNVKVN